MTAEKVDGHAVIATERIESPLSTPEKPVHYTRVVLLLLDDDSTVYGCTECDFTGAALGVLRWHLREHNDKPAASWGTRKPRKRGGIPATSPLPDISLAELLSSATRADAMADALERLSADRNEWKARALKAERAMSVLKKLLS